MALPPAQSTQPAPKPLSSKFADVGSEPQNILDLRRRALQGSTAPEIGAQRASAVEGIEGTSRSLQRDLSNRQNLQGVRGGIAFAQGENIRSAALKARAGTERDIFLDDLTRRRQALNDLQSFVGKERFGGISADLGERQLATGEQAGLEERELQRQLLNAIFGNSQPQSAVPAQIGAAAVDPRVGGGQIPRTAPTLSPEQMAAGNQMVPTQVVAPGFMSEEEKARIFNNPFAVQG